MNYYSVLGLTDAATTDDVKKAYRRLASQHHPDKGGDANKFKQVQTAYEQIIAGNQGPWYATGFAANPDDLISVTISLLNAHHGAEIVVNTRTSQQLIAVPPGVPDGTRIRIPGKGFHRLKQHAPGDLIVIVNIHYPDGVSRQGNNVHQTLCIDAIDAMVGNSVTLTHYAGKQLNVKIPAGSQPGSKLKLTGCGLPDLGTNTVGDLVVHLQIRVPTITKLEQITTLNRIKQEVNT